MARPAPSLTDENAMLLDELRAGSERAFSAFHRQHSGRLYAYLVRLTRDRSEADDLFQETWLRLARAAPTLAEETDLRAFVFTIARHAFIDARRRKRHTISWDDDAPEPKAPGPDLEEVLADRQRLAFLEGALETLSDGAREILHLIAFEGLTPLEASELLGMKPEATRKRLERARADLALALLRATDQTHKERR